MRNGAESVSNENEKPFSEMVGSAIDIAVAVSELIFEEHAKNFNRDRVDKLKEQMKSSARRLEKTPAEIAANIFCMSFYPFFEENGVIGKVLAKKLKSSPWDHS
jgi:hypothetical protein